MDQRVTQVIRDMTDGGVDYSFDCTGDVGVIKSALECCVEVSFHIPHQESFCSKFLGNGNNIISSCEGEYFWGGILKYVVQLGLQWGGVSCILGLVESSQRVKFHPASLLWGRVWTSGLFGGYKGRTQLPGLVDRCIKGVSIHPQ